MPDTDMPASEAELTRQLLKLAEMLSLEIAPEDLAALANQLALIESLEASALREYPPILTMDADWHD